MYEEKKEEEGIGRDIKGCLDSQWFSISFWVFKTQIKNSSLQKASHHTFPILIRRLRRTSFDLRERERDWRLRERDLPDGRVAEWLEGVWVEETGSGVGGWKLRA